MCVVDRKYVCMYVYDSILPKPATSLKLYGVGSNAGFISGMRRAARQAGGSIVGGVVGALVLF